VKRFFAVFVLGICAASSRANVVDPAPQRGRTVSSINWIDETGRVRRLSEFSGYPLILLPIYTRCPGACQQNVDRLKAALADASNNPRQFRVLLFSFDPTDEAARLVNYRQHENVPLGWSIGAASQTNIDTLLESIGIQVGNAGVEFTHPNIVVFLDSKLRVAKWIYGTAYTGRDVDLALRVASGESDWIGRYAQLLYALLLFAGSVLCVALCYHLMELFALRRSNRTGPGIHPFATDR